MQLSTFDINILVFKVSNTASQIQVQRPIPFSYCINFSSPPLYTNLNLAAITIYTYQDLIPIIFLVYFINFSLTQKIK